MLGIISSMLLSGSVSENIGQWFLDVFGNPYVTTFIIAMLPIVELRGAIPFGYFYSASTGTPMGWFASFGLGYLGSSVVVPIILLALIPILNWLKKTRLFKRPADWIDRRFSKKADKLKNNAIIKAKIQYSDFENRSLIEQEKIKEDAIKEAISATKNFESLSAKKQEKIKNTAIDVAIANCCDMSKMSEEKRKEIELDIDKKLLWAKIIGVFAFVAVPLPLTGVWTGSAVAAFLNIDFKKALPAILIGNLVAGIAVTLITVFFGVVI